MSQLPFLHVYCTCIYMYIKKTINEYFFCHQKNCIYCRENFFKTQITY